MLKVQASTHRQIASAEVRTAVGCALSLMAGQVEAYKRLTNAQCTLTPLRTHVWYVDEVIMASLCLLPVVDGQQLMWLKNYLPRSQFELFLTWLRCAEVRSESPP